MLLHPHPPVLCVCYQQESGKRKFLSLSALDHPKDLLTLPQPGICLVWGGFACKFRRLVTHEVLHRHWSDRGNHRPRCAVISCIASTILWIALAISSAPALFLRLLLAIACARHIIQLFTLNNSKYKRETNNS